jgi:hypothetical protein
MMLIRSSPDDRADLFTHFHIKPDELLGRASCSGDLKAAEGLEFQA